MAEGGSGDVASPCVGICRISPASGLCVGCSRTLEEIAGWSAADADERRRILGRIGKRRAAAGATRRVRG